MESSGSNSDIDDEIRDLERQIEKLKKLKKKNTEKRKQRNKQKEDECEKTYKGIRDKDSKKEGFWFPENDYIPIEGKKWKGQKDFIKKFRAITENAKKCKCLPKKMECWICGKRLGGSHEHFRSGQHWAGTYLHYISEHNIKPTKKFIKFVMDYEETEDSSDSSDNSE